MEELKEYEEEKTNYCDTWPKHRENHDEYHQHHEYRPSIRSKLSREETSNEAASSYDHVIDHHAGMIFDTNTENRSGRGQLEPKPLSFRQVVG